jgi:hypothetical protein
MTDSWPANVQRIVVPQPAWIGGACYCLEEKGTYVLAEGPGIIWQVACTHAGTGALVVSDGAFTASGLTRRKLLNLNPAAMGVWHLNAGFSEGLIVESTGGAHISTPAAPVASIVWQTKKVTSDDGKRSFTATANGTYVLTEKTVKLYEILISKAGAGRVIVSNGMGRRLYHMPSQFAGSFNLGNVSADAGIVLTVDSSIAMAVTCVWIELG